MSASIPSSIPDSLPAGDTWEWTESIADYLASDGWALKYRFKNATSGFEITAAADGDAYAVDVAAATTAAYAAGGYDFIAWVEKAGELHTVKRGRFKVAPNLRAGSASDALDLRSSARKQLERLELALEARDPTLAAHSIQTAAGVRSVTYADLAAVRVDYDRVKADVLREEDAARVAAGGKSRRNIRVRFGR